MKWVRDTSGFTLVEVVMVIAITSLLLAGVLAGRSQLSQDASFSASIDQAKNQFRQIQNEAVHSLSGSGGTGKSSGVIFGRIAELDPANRTQVTVSTLVGQEQDGKVVALAKCAPNTVTLKSGVQYAGAATKAVIFTRNPSQVFVSPDNYTQASTMACPLAADVETTVPHELTDPCPGGFTRTDANPLGSCTAVVTPLAPNPFIAKDGGGATIATTATTAAEPGSTLDDNIVLEATVPLGSRVDFYVDGSLYYRDAPIQTVGGRTFATAPYELRDTSIHRFDARARVGSSATQSPDATLYVRKGNPVTCSASVVQGYRCGLKGEYFKGDDFDRGGTLRPESTYVDTQVGSSLGGGAGASAYPSFIQTLQARTAQIAAQYASVRWTGQLFVDPGSNQYCVHADDNVVMYLGSSQTPFVTDGDFGNGENSPMTCAAVDGGADGAWQDVRIEFEQNYLPIAYMRLVKRTGTASNGTPTGADVAASKLRVREPITTDSPDPLQPGLNAIYDDRAWYSSSSSGASYENEETVDGVGSASSPATWPNWKATLQTKANDSQGMGAYWRGYMFIEEASTYQFCMEEADAGGVSLDGSWVLYDDNSTAQPVQSCSATVNLENRQYPLFMFNEDEPGNPSGSTSFKLSFRKYDDTTGQWSALVEVPNSWYARNNWFVSQAGSPTADIAKIKERILEESRSIALHSRTTMHKTITALFLPGVAHAAACAGNTNVLDPEVYSQRCPDFMPTGDAREIEFEIPSETTRRASILFDPTTNTINKDFD